MTDGAAEFERLSRNWFHWSGLAQLGGASVSRSCPDCAVLFGATESSVHLRHAGEWWSVDTVNERGSRHADSALFSTFALAEKYLIWMWGSEARTVVQAPILGQRLYALGFDNGVETIALGPGKFEVRSPAGRAVLIEPYATIFSHLMGRSVPEIEEMLQFGGPGLGVAAFRCTASLEADLPS